MDTMPPPPPSRDVLPRQTRSEKKAAKKAEKIRRKEAQKEARELEVHCKHTLHPDRICDYCENESIAFYENKPGGPTLITSLARGSTLVFVKVLCRNSTCESLSYVDFTVCHTLDEVEAQIIKKTETPRSKIFGEMTVSVHSITYEEAVIGRWYQPF
jgi:hypothetical protein